MVVELPNRDTSNIRVPITRHIKLDKCYWQRSWWERAWSHIFVWSTSTKEIYSDARPKIKFHNNKVVRHVWDVCHCRESLISAHVNIARKMFQLFKDCVFRQHLAHSPKVHLQNQRLSNALVLFEDAMPTQSIPNF